jgi:hypothetical protein
MNLEHGDYSVAIDGNIIIATMKGSFNEYGARALTGQMRANIESFHGTCFCILVNALELDGLTPKGYEELDKYNDWLNCQNMLAKAMVGNSDTISTIINSRIPSKREQNIKEFDNILDAMTWLKLQS